MSNPLNKKIVMSLMKVDQNSLMPKFSSLWEDFFGKNIMEPNWRQDVSMPAVNIEEKDNAFEVALAVPGMQHHDFKIEVNNGVLSISSKKEDKHEEKDKEGRYTRREFRYHTFNRSFTLPETIDEDKITAEYKDGILTVHLPKKEPRQQQAIRNITVK